MRGSPEGPLLALFELTGSSVGAGVTHAGVQGGLAVAALHSTTHTENAWVTPPDASLDLRLQEPGFICIYIYM